MIEGNREPTARTAIVRKAYAVFRIRHRNASELAQFTCSEAAFGYFHNKIRASRGEQEKT